MKQKLNHLGNSAVWLYAASVVILGAAVLINNFVVTCYSGRGLPLVVAAVGSCLAGYATFVLLANKTKWPLWLRLIIPLLVAPLAFIGSVILLIDLQPDGFFRCFEF